MAQDAADLHCCRYSEDCPEGSPSIFRHGVKAGVNETARSELVAGFSSLVGRVSHPRSREFLPKPPSEEYNGNLFLASWNSRPTAA